MVNANKNGRIEDPVIVAGIAQEVRTTEDAVAEQKGAAQCASPFFHISF